MSRHKTTNIRVICSLFWSPIRAELHTSISTCPKLAICIFTSFELIWFSISLAKLKQTYIISFSAFQNPSRQPPHDQKLSHFLSIPFLHFENFWPKASKSSSHSCFLHHLDNLVKLFGPSNLNCSAASCSVFFMDLQWWIEICKFLSLAEPNNFKHSASPSIVDICLRLYHSKNHCFTNFFITK